MSKRYKNTGMSVEDRIVEGICEGCDCDPAQCYNLGYCYYDKEEESDGENIQRA